MKNLITIKKIRLLTGQPFIGFAKTQYITIVGVAQSKAVFLLSQDKENLMGYMFAFGVIALILLCVILAALD